MPTTAGYLYIIAMSVLFFLWIYGAVSLYFDLRYRYLPWLRSWLQQHNNKRHLL